LGSLNKYRVLKTANQRANMRLQANIYLDTGMGVAAEIEARRIQGRGAFLHMRVISTEKTRKPI
jgi:hypothetical protein